MLDGRAISAIHAGLIQSRIGAGGFVERQQVRLNAVAEIRNHHLGVVGELAQISFYVVSCQGHTINQKFRIDAAIQRT